MSEADNYFADRRNWAKNAIAANLKSTRIAWTIAFLSLALVGVQSLVIFALLPLRSTQTVPILVDRTTGFTQVLEPDGTQSLRADEALVQSLLAQYVVARERLDPALINRDYRKTALWSSGVARESYLRLMSSQNPQSPLQTLRDQENLGVTVKSVSQIAPGQALVRFDTFNRGRSNNGNVEGSWIAAINYEFLDAPMSFDDRLLNPLGLQVSAYRRDSERPVQPQSTSLGPEAEETAQAEFIEPINQKVSGE